MHHLVGLDVNVNLLGLCNGSTARGEEFVNKMSTQSGENGTLTCLLELSVGPPRLHCTPATPRVSD